MVDEKKTEEIEEEKDSEKSGKLFLGGLSIEATEDDVVNYFSKYGELIQVRVPTHHSWMRKNKGFGFVTFKDISNAERVLAETNHEICGKLVDVKFSDQNGNKNPRATDTTIPGLIDSPIIRPASRSGSMAGGTISSNSSTVSCASSTPEFNGKCFVGGLASSVTNDILREYFTDFGKVTNCTVMMDRETNRSRGFGFVTFIEEEGLRCVLEPTQQHSIKGKRVEVKQAIPREVIESQQRAAMATSQQHRVQQKLSYPYAILAQHNGGAVHFTYQPIHPVMSHNLVNTNSYVAYPNHVQHHHQIPYVDQQRMQYHPRQEQYVPYYQEYYYSTAPQAHQIHQMEATPPSRSSTPIESSTISQKQA